jgi:hypothetical protein
MEIERPPFDLCAELALKPRGPLEADVAERSYVVTPDRDLGRFVERVGHARHSRERVRRADRERRTGLDSTDLGI